MKESKPPCLANKLFEWYCGNAAVEDLHGDMEESFYADLEKMSVRKAKLKYWRQTISLIFSYAIKKRKQKSAQHFYSSNTISMDMIFSYLKVGVRNLFKNKGYSFINIGGLSIGLAVTMMIGLWVRDEFSFEKYNRNYNTVAEVMQHQTFDDHRRTEASVPIPLANELREKYGHDFKQVALASWLFQHILSAEDKNLLNPGIYMEEGGPEIFGLTMIKGSINGLKDNTGILLSQSTALALFGEHDALNKTVRIDNKIDAKVTGIYQDLPMNSRFSGMYFMASWELYINSEPWAKLARDENQWGNSSFQLFVQLAENSEMNETSAKIRLAKYNNMSEMEKTYQPEIFLWPMKDWRLRDNWVEGIQKGGRGQQVWLMSIVGCFVLLLASINFMNLSTARSEKRAREVGVRKAIGSRRNHLIVQFFSESFLVVVLAFFGAMAIVVLLMPWFNLLTSKKIVLPINDPGFWMSSITFLVVVGLLSGSYPAFFLSSFNPVKVLKGTYRIGKFAQFPRKVLVVVQYTVSITLIIATIIVYQQVQYSKSRPIGYDPSGILMIKMNTPDFYGKYDLLRNELKSAAAAIEMAGSSSPLTEVWSANGGMRWEGKDPSNQGEFATIFVSHDFGKTTGWQMAEGRDFSREFPSDSSAIIINEAAIKYMGIKNPVGKIIHWGDDVHGRDYHIVGVVKDLLMESPFKSVYQTIYFMNYENVNWIEIKLNPKLSLYESISKTEGVFKKLLPNAPFAYKFVDDEHARKFASEEQVGMLAAIFSTLAILISCLGLFGLASFVAQQRTKEISIRKVLGASLVNVWTMLSTDFVKLVFISLFLSIPISYFVMENWLSHYDYRTSIGWWVFAISGVGALIITMLTISYQCVKAALINPVNSLKTE